MENFEELIRNSPIDLKEIKKHSRKFYRFCNIKNKLVLDSMKESLLEARGELEKMITLVLNYMKKDDIQLNKKITDIIYEEFSINFSGFMRQIDEQQDEQFVKVGENDMNISRLIAFKIFLETSYFDIIFIPLKLASESYSKKKDLSEYYYNWFMGVASTLKVKAGLRRERIKSSLFKGKGQYHPYSFVLQNLNKKEDGGKSPVDEEYESLFGEEELE